MTTTDTTSVWNMSYKPFIWFAVFGCVLLFLAMLSHLFGSALPPLSGAAGWGRLSDARHRFARRGLSVGWRSSVCPASARAPAQGVIGMVYMFTMFFLGMPVAFALMGTSLVFIASLRGLTALNLFGTAWFSTCSSYTWAPLMFFLLMGFLCFYSRFGEDLLPHGPQLVRPFPRRSRHSQRVRLHRPRRVSPSATPLSAVSP